MMKQIIVLALIFLESISSLPIDDVGSSTPLSTSAGMPLTKKCGNNEIFNTCSKIGANCEELCDHNPNSPPKPCHKICKSGCDCIAGFYRNDKRECVSREECDGTFAAVSAYDLFRQCGENETFHQCSLSAPGCHPHCDDLKPNLTFAERGRSYNCPAICSPGCDCKNGYYYSRRGCVPKEECEEINRLELEASNKEIDCGKNEIFRKSRQFDQYCKLDVIASFGRPGCVCMHGFYRNDKRECVSSDDCESEIKEIDCGKNEIFRKRQQYERNCGSGILNFSFKLGCVCMDGFHRNDKNECVPRDDC